jgi:hypothetical protein
MSSDGSKPDPSYFIAMRQVRQGDTNRCNEFLPSTNPNGFSPRKKKETVRKWKPTATTENSRPDEWMGGGPKAARSWKVKSVSTKAHSSDSDDDDDEKDKAPDLGESKPSESKPNPVEQKVKPAPTPTSAPTPAAEPEPRPELQAVSNDEESEVEVQSDTEVEVQSDTEIEVHSDTEIEVQSDDEEGTAVKPEPFKKKQPASPKKKQPASPKKKQPSSPKKQQSAATFEKIERPDPTAFRNAMRMEQNAGASQIDEYLPSAHEGSSKKRGEPAVRKWKPTSPTTANRRPDEWLGASPSPSPSSWKPKAAPDNSRDGSPSKWTNPSSPLRKVGVPSAFSSRLSHQDANNTSVATPLKSIKKSYEFDHDNSQGSFSFKVNSEPKEGEAPTKKDASPKKQHHFATTFDKIERPDPTAFRNAMRMEQDAGASQIDEYLPSAHEGSSRKRGEPAVRKWKPTSPTTANSRPDEWLGASPSSAPSWKPKPPPDSNKDGSPENPPPLVQSSMSSTAPKWTNPSSPLRKVGVPSAFSSDPSPVATPSFSAKKSQEFDPDNSLGSLSAISLQKGESNFEVNSEAEEGEAPTKKDDGSKKDDTNKKPTTPHHNRMWKSSSGFDYSNNVVNKPDPSPFLAMRKVRQGDTNRCNEFLPSANPNGFSPRKKETVRKWKPTATTENSRPDEWMGGGPKVKRSWKVKSISTKPPSSDSDSDDDDKKNKTGNSIPTWKAKTVEKAPELTPAPAAAAPVPAPAPVAKEEPIAVAATATAADDDDYTEVEVESDSEVEVESEDEEEPVKKQPESPRKKAPPAKPEPPKRHELPKVEIQRPDAESFRNAMRQVREGETTRCDEFLPSGNPHGTRKRGEPVKKWKPTATAENSRPDEWMGSGKKAKARSWTVKSVSTKPPLTGGNDSE